MNKKRKADATPDEDLTCECLFDQLNAALAQRVKATDEYVARARQGIELARADVQEKQDCRETALRQRELAVQARERAAEQKTAELTVLRAEVSGLYHQLQAQLPDLQARVRGLECLEDRQRSAGASEGAHFSNHEQIKTAEDDACLSAQPDTALPEAHVQPPTAPEPFLAQPGAAAAEQAAVHGDQRPAAQLHAAERHMPGCKAELPPSRSPALGSCQPSAMPSLPVRYRPHVGAAGPNAASSPFHGSAFSRVELLGGSREGCCGSQGLPQKPATDQPSSPRKFAPHARPPVPKARIGGPLQMWDGPYGVPSGPGVMPQNRGVPLGIGRGLPESAKRRVGLEGEGPRQDRGFRARGGLRGGGRARGGRIGNAATKGGTPSFERDADGRKLDDTVQQLRALTHPQQLPGAPLTFIPGKDTCLPQMPTQLPGSSVSRRGAGTTRKVSRARKKIEAASAVPALAADAPGLLLMLKRQDFYRQLPLLDPAAANSEDAASSSDLTSNLQDLFSKVHGILGRILTHAAGKAANEKSSVPDAKTGSEYTRKGYECYTLAVLQCLIEAADKYSETGSAPVHWGWCRELQSFVFVFETANRIVVEKPEYSHATYFFELEQPLPVHAQVQRLVAVLSVPAVTRGCLLADAAPHLAADALSDADAAVLRAAGWTPGGGLRSLLNFSGERSLHRVDDRDAKSDAGAEVAHYRERLARLLQQGAAGGRLNKPWQAPPPTAAGATSAAAPAESMLYRGPKLKPRPGG